MNLHFFIYFLHFSFILLSHLYIKDRINLDVTVILLKRYILIFFSLKCTELFVPLCSFLIIILNKRKEKYYIFNLKTKVVYQYKYKVRSNKS